MKGYPLSEEAKEALRKDKLQRGECECLKCTERAVYQGFCGKCFLGEGACE